MENFDKMIASLQNAHKRMDKIEQDLDLLRVTSEAGAGAVKATVNGHKTVLKLEIAEEYIRLDEKEVLQDLIVAVINSANKKAEDKIKEKINWEVLEKFDEK